MHVSQSRLQNSEMKEEEEEEEDEAHAASLCLLGSPAYESTDELDKIKFYTFGD